MIRLTKQLVVSPGDLNLRRFPISLSLGETFADRYHVIRLLGRGGMGAVYLAEHVVFHRNVALKVFYAGEDDDHTSAHRFLREARLTFGIEHNNVVRAYDAGQQGPFLYLAMEHLDGLDFAKILRQEGPIEWSQLRPLAVQIGSGLTAIHNAGLVHRDVKPSNCVLHRDATGAELVKLIDLGIARPVERYEDALTENGQVLGTLPFIAPEVFAGNPATPKSDQYAFAATIFQLLTGGLPEHHPPICETLSPVIEVLERALDPNPAHRFANIAAFSKAFEEVSVSSTRTTIFVPAPRKSNLFRYTSIFIGLVSVITALIVSLQQEPPQMKLPTVASSAQADERWRFIPGQRSNASTVLVPVEDEAEGSSTEDPPVECEAHRSVRLKLYAGDYTFVWVRLRGCNRRSAAVAVEPVAEVRLRPGRYRVQIAQRRTGPWRDAGAIRAFSPEVHAHVREGEGVTKLEIKRFP